ncbi:hypothetical protein [Paenibacillus mesotrionivorans]|uniref:Uncharacterized protein n=1 Tax=Paenibacillus mesotrionivorans TaxID=3160968 RepID=A0ACC7NV99_9BACL
MKTFNILVWDNQRGDFIGAGTLRTALPITLGWSVDSRSGCVTVTDMESGAKAVYCRGFFHRVTGTNPDAIAGRFDADATVLSNLGFTNERKSCEAVARH